MPWAEGFLRARYEVASAGHIPIEVHPLAVMTMAEMGINISAQRAKHVRKLLGQRFDYVVTLCGEDAPRSCPFFPGGKKYLQAPFPDPARMEGDLKDRLAAFRQVRDAPFAFSSSGTELLFFYDEGCPRCKEVEAFLRHLQETSLEFTFRQYEIQTPEGWGLLLRLLSAYGAELGPVPMVFVGDVAMVGDKFYGLLPWTARRVWILGKGRSGWSLSSG